MAPLSLCDQPISLANDLLLKDLVVLLLDLVLRRQPLMITVAKHDNNINHGSNNSNINQH